ncbi:MAG: biotin transporter BioY [Oscillospiraceae bacterium]|nr:biotin transporter BioY [Oscillospiraceae bacterium]
MVIFMKKQKKITAFDLCLISVFVAAIAAMAQLTIPIPIVPLTMQTFAIPLAGAVLGAKRGAIAAAVYVLLGIVGAPVFAGLTGGIGTIAGPTGGFLIAFPVFALITGFAADKSVNSERNCNKENRLWLAVGLIVGAIVTFLIGGIIWPVIMFEQSLKTAFLGWVAPFLLGDLIKIAMVFAIAPEIRKVLAKIPVRS